VVIWRGRLKEAWPSPDATARANWRPASSRPGRAREAYECGVVVTSLGERVLTAQFCRDRVDSENPFDELKNHRSCFACIDI
jgi:hypothetical protein